MVAREEDQARLEGGAGLRFWGRALGGVGLQADVCGPQRALVRNPVGVDADAPRPASRYGARRFKNRANAFSVASDA